MNFTHADVTLGLSLMLIGYIIAKWSKLDELDNRYIEIILIIIGGISYVIIHNDIFQFVYGALIGIMASGSYNALDNCTEIIREKLFK